MTKSTSFFRTIIDSMVESRARQARRYVNGAILMLDDSTLERYGIERSSLQSDRLYRKLM